jgi:asparagine synthase (glutamine-hydrolysing)
MCGITGYWVRRGDATRWLADMDAAVEALRRRGPDDRGVWVRPGGRVALGHTRLSILDLSPLGHQPMHSPGLAPSGTGSNDGAISMVFNGEVYNFAAIRADLESLGHRFRSSGDSEVILAAYRQWGVAAAEKFIGMFAIAFWDERTHQLVLLRDRMGVKPLYYAWDGDVMWFGSELKALRAHRAWEPRIDSNALGEYLQYGYVSAPRAIYRNVHKLLPGHWLELGELGEPKVHRYWAPPLAEPTEATEEELEERLEHLLIDAFRYRMISDVPLGVFLSGGIDSSLVAAILKVHGGGELRTFTIGFDDPRFDESGRAREVARHLGTRHTERILSGRDMRDVLTHWADLFDEPFGDSSGVPTYLVSLLARENVKVALSADGGDELFHGYNHYGVCLERERFFERVPGAARRAMSAGLNAFAAGGIAELTQNLPLPAGLRHVARRGVAERLDKLTALLPNIDRVRLYDFALTSWAPWEIAPLTGAAPRARDSVEPVAGTFAEQMSYNDLRYFLPDDILVKVDRTTMATGLEGREPLLDHRIVEFALKLPLRYRRGPLGPKHLLRKILYRYVPREILERPKQGFAVPLAPWLRGELAPLVSEYLSERRIREGGLFDPARVARAVANFREGGAGNDRLDSQKLWYLLAFEMWREKWMTRDTTPAEVRHAHSVRHQ